MFLETMPELYVVLYFGIGCVLAAAVYGIWMVYNDYFNKRKLNNDNSSNPDNNDGSGEHSCVDRDSKMPETAEERKERLEKLSNNIHVLIATGRLSPYEKEFLEEAREVIEEGLTDEGN